MFKGEFIPYDDHKLGHFSLEAAEFIHNVLRPKIVAVQAPSLDRAICKHCDVHRILFGLSRDPVQTKLNSNQTISPLLVGENFHFSPDIPDGIVIFEAGGINFVGMDATLSNSYIYQIEKV